MADQSWLGRDALAGKHLASAVAAYVQHEPRFAMGRFALHIQYILVLLASSAPTSTATLSTASLTAAHSPRHPSMPAYAAMAAFDAASGATAAAAALHPALNAATVATHECSDKRHLSYPSKWLALYWH